MRRLLRTVSVLLLLVAAAPLGADEDDDARTRARWAELRGEALERMHGLANWCTGAKMFRARADVYEAILHFEPDDPDARKWLKYKRAEDGTWTRKKNYRRPRDMGKGRATYEAKHAALAAWFLEEARALIEATESVDDPTLARRIVLGSDAAPHSGSR